MNKKEETLVDNGRHGSMYDQNAWIKKRETLEATNRNMNGLVLKFIVFKARSVHTIKTAEKKKRHQNA